jgi:MoxR-like ATPase
MQPMTTTAPHTGPGDPSPFPSQPATSRHGAFSGAPQPPTAEAAQLEAALFEVKRVIVGQERVIERLFVCLLAQGHCLLEGVPGLAKTLAMETLARIAGGTFSRLQFTPDLLPADIVGTRIYRHSTETFDVELGPIFANFVLADEVNRAPAKVQSALLEVMAERQVSIAGHTYAAPDPFLVLATQNPIESEGVYQLPEAQRDRFLMKVQVDYPTPSEEVEIVHRMGVNPPTARQVLTPADLVRLQQAARDVYVDRGVVDYAVNVVLATRSPREFGLAEVEPLIEYGASPRASLGLVAAARALALLRGRRYAVPQDVFDVAPEVLRHRLVLSYEALAQGLVVDQITARVLSTVPAPRVTPMLEGMESSTGYGNVADRNGVGLAPPLTVGRSPWEAPADSPAGGGGAGDTAGGGSQRIPAAPAAAPASTTSGTTTSGTTANPPVAGGSTAASPIAPSTAASTSGVPAANPAWSDPAVSPVGPGERHGQ